MPTPTPRPTRSASTPTPSSVPTNTRAVNGCILSVSAKVVSRITANASVNKEINSSAISVLSKERLDAQVQKCQLEQAFYRYAESERDAVRDFNRTPVEELETKRLLTVQTAISLVGEGNCLYYLGRATEACDRYEGALRQLENLQFETKPVLCSRISANLAMSRQLEKENPAEVALAERLAKLSEPPSEAVTSDGGIAWLTSEDNACEFTMPL